MSSVSDTLNPEEHATLKSFRKAVEDIIQPTHNDRFLLRWLRARNFNLYDAEEMLRNHMAWRKLTRADDILRIHKQKEVTAKYWPMGIIGSNKSGSPVCLVRYGDADVKGLVFSTTRSDALYEFTYFMESVEHFIKKKTQEKGEQDAKAVAIVDMANTSFYATTSVPVARRFKDIVGWFEANYPEILKSIYIINAPTFIKIIMTFIKSLLDERTFKKIHVYGKDGWKEKLLEEIDESVLPVKFGGTRIGPGNDLNGNDLVVEGGTVPKSYYIQCKLTNEEDAKTVQVDAGKSYTVEIPIEKSNSVISWEFKTKDYNIAFGLLCVTDDDVEEIIAVTKQNCHSIPENGSWLCLKPGKYVLKFDNTYSWIRSKTLSYWVAVLPPDGE